MRIQCQNCGTNLSAGDKFIQKIKDLGEGEVLRVKCSHCSAPITISKDLLNGVKKKKEDDSRVNPPPPPDTSWLQDYKEGADTGAAEELPTVLVLMEASPRREAVSTSFVSHGYRVEYAKNSVDAIEKMQFFVYAAVVQDESFDASRIVSTGVYRYISGMNMAKRRQILYILIGDRFRTTYDLEALCYSANMVVNTADINYFNTLLRKAIRENEVLFGPLINELQAAGH